MKTGKYLLIASVILSLFIIVAVSWHSLDEIHYLKTFYPPRFTVEEAYYASWVELIKVHIISLPLLVIIILSVYSLRLLRKRD